VLHLSWTFTIKDSCLGSDANGCHVCVTNCVICLHNGSACAALLPGAQCLAVRSNLYFNRCAVCMQVAARCPWQCEPSLLIHGRKMRCLLSCMCCHGGCCRRLLLHRTYWRAHLLSRAHARAGCGRNSCMPCGTCALGEGCCCLSSCRLPSCCCNTSAPEQGAAGAAACHVGRVPQVRKCRYGYLLVGCVLFGSMRSASVSRVRQEQLQAMWDVSTGKMQRVRLFVCLVAVYVP
jgi:hypothetical protein